MKAKQLLLILFVFIGLSGMTQIAPEPSDAVLKQAFQKAASQDKKVILIFHASWCGWCKKMEASINDPLCKKMFDDNYVIAYLDVMEQKEKQNLENPGSMEVMKKYEGDRSGLPFWLILDDKGKTLANSELLPDGATAAKPEDNVGCPASEKEVAYFTKVLKSTSKLSDMDLGIIHQRFLKNQPAVH